VSYAYDNLYRLTNETIAGDPHAMNGAVSYVYDPVGDRMQKTSTLPGYPGGLSNYNANDQWKQGKPGQETKSRIMKKLPSPRPERYRKVKIGGIFISAAYTVIAGFLQRLPDWRSPCRRLPCSSKDVLPGSSAVAPPQSSCPRAKCSNGL